MTEQLLKEILGCLRYQNQLSEDILGAIQDLGRKKPKDSQIAESFDKIREVLLGSGPGSATAIKVFDQMVGAMNLESRG